MLQPLYVVEGWPDILIVCSMWHVDQNDNKTIMKTITSGVKNGPFCLFGGLVWPE